MDFIFYLLNPETVSLIAIISGIAYRGFKTLHTFLSSYDTKQDELLNKLTLSLDELSKESQDRDNELKMEVIRIQILTGIDAKRLSISEVMYFYDKYKTSGGNSFVTEKVNEYVKSREDLEKETK